MLQVAWCILHVLGGMLRVERPYALQAAGKPVPLRRYGLKFDDPPEEVSLLPKNLTPQSFNNRIRCARAKIRTPLR